MSTVFCKRDETSSIKSLNVYLLFSSSLNSAISSFISSSSEQSKSLHIAIIFSVSGYAAPDSHLDTACLDTPNLKARSS